MNFRTFPDMADYLPSVTDGETEFQSSQVTQELHSDMTLALASTGEELVCVAVAYMPESLQTEYIL